MTVGEFGFVAGLGDDPVASLNIGAELGEAAAAPGTLVTEGPITVGGSGDISFVFNHTGTQDQAYAFSAGISGSGAVLVEAGHTVFSGDNSGLTGPVTVDGGTMIVASSMGASTISIADAGTDAHMTVRSGHSVTATGAVVVGNGLDTSGTLLVRGDLSTESDFTAGVNGTGTVIIGRVVRSRSAAARFLAAWPVAAVPSRRSVSMLSIHRPASGCRTTSRSAMGDPAP